MNKTSRGFTLIELMVVIAIIALLTTVVFVGARPASEQSRDAQRQADLREVQTALELYKSRHGRYPEGCNSPGNWSGQVDADYQCSDSRDPYILGQLPDRPFAEFMVNVPQDPLLNGTDSGYVYTTNTAGTVYKFMIKNTVESEVVTVDHPFKSCSDECDSTLSHCQADASQFQTSYAVWGGYDAPAINSTPAQVQAATEDTICEIP